MWGGEKAKKAQIKDRRAGGQGEKDRRTLKHGRGKKKQSA